MTSQDTVKGFDLDNYGDLASSEGVWMQLSDPVTEAPLLNNDGKPVRIKLIGSDSPEFRTKEREFINRRLSRNKVSFGSAEQLEAESIETLVVCTVGWEGFIRGGQDWAFSPDNVRELYSSLKWRWIFEQVNKFVGDRKNFLRKSKTT